MPSKQPNSNSQLRWGLYRLNNANTDILLSRSVPTTNMAILDHYIQQLRKVSNKPDQSNVAHQPNKSKQSNGASTATPTASSSASFESATICATSTSCIGCTSSACAKSEPTSPYFKPNTTTAIGRTGEFFGSCGGNTEQFFGSTTKGKNECGRSWNSVSTRFNSQTKFGSTQYVSNNGIWAVNPKRNFNERPNNDGTINNNPFISNSI